MTKGRKILLFELNEVPWKVALDYCKKFPESTFARIVSKSYKYETICPDNGELSPWITWPTFHRGVNNEKHHISDFNQDLTEANKKYPSVWEILHNKGITTGVFGSFHSTPPPSDYKDYSFFVPDAFSSDSRAHPEYIEPFQNFNLVMSRESSRNVSSKIDVKSGLGMVMRIPQLGLRMRTFMELGKHLIDERKRPWVKARRRTYQVVLAFDVFFKLIRKTKPQFVQIMKELKLDLPKKIKESLPANLACGTPEKNDKSSKFETLTPQELKARLDQALVIDVRGLEEYFGELGHIKDSHQITLGDELKQFLEGYSRSEEIVFVCRSGQRSQEAAKTWN